jgi:hypothetical protein
MPRQCLAVAACFLALLLPSPILNAQQAEGDRVAGIVVGAIDGRPLAHATVTLTDLKTERAAATTISDDDGHFRFDPVAPGKYRITGIAAHYLSTSYLEHEQYSTAIVTGAGLATDALVLQLIPASSISGRVLDDTGEPVQHAAVTLYRENLTGAERVTRYSNTVANEDGEYELLGLPRGRYYLSVSGTPWYAIHPPPEQESATPSYRIAVDPALDVAYPTIFYPDALDSDGASPLIIDGGEQLTADMQMHPQHAVTLTLRLPPGEKSNQLMPQLTHQVFGAEEPIFVQTEFTQGTRTLTAIPPGQYNVEEMVGGNGFPVRSGRVDLTTGSTSMDISEPADLATITVTVHDAGGASLPAQMQVMLRGARPNLAIGNMLTDKGTADLANVPRGDYSFVLNGVQSMRVVRLAINGKPVADKRLHITGGGNVAIDLAVSSAAVRVEGFARRDGQPVAASMVVLVPAGADTSEDLFRRDQSDLDGSFVLNGVVPGDYILVAIDDGWPLRWTDMPSLAPYLAHGLPISVTANGSSSLHIADTVATQPR